MTGLADPLDDEQQYLVDLVWSTFVEHGEFPKFFYVNHRMRRRGHNTVAVLNSFPAVGTVLTHRYRAVGWWGTDHNPDHDGVVFLTVAGLYHVQDAPVAEMISRGLLVFMRELTKAQDAIFDSPFAMPDVEVDLATSVTRADAEGGYVGHMATIAEQEWPGIRYNKGTRTGRLGMVADADFSTVGDYLAAVTATLSPPEPPAALPYAEPRALLRAFNFLDVTTELVLGHRLVSRPPMDRSSLLALDIEDEAGFQAGLVVLTDILRDLQVPGGAPASALGRLEGPPRPSAPRYRPGRGTAGRRTPRPNPGVAELRGSSQAVDATPRRSPGARLDLPRPGLHGRMGQCPGACRAGAEPGARGDSGRAAVM